MPTIKVQVSGKVAKNLTPEIEIVCNNEDYEIEYYFDEAWSGALAKTGLFICNGELIPVPFDGNVCPVPIIENAKLLAVGVSTSDGKLATTTPAYVNCLLSASDLAKNKIPPPSKSVYDEIIALLNKYLQQGGGEGAKEIVTVDIAAMLSANDGNGDVDLFLNLSERYKNGEIIVVGTIGSDVGVLTGAKYLDDDEGRAKADWYLTGLYWSGLTTTSKVTELEMTAYIFQCDGTKILFDTVSVPLGEPLVKEALTKPSESWTPDEQAAACETIGAVKKDTTTSKKLRLYAVNPDGSQTVVDTNQNYSSNDIARFDGGGRLSSNTPTSDNHVANKLYVDGKVGDIETALDNIIAIQNTLIGGGTQ